LLTYNKFVGVLTKGYRYPIKGGKYYEPKMSDLKGASQIVRIGVPMRDFAT